MHNLIFFVVPPENQADISLKAGMLYLNPVCIDEDAACELSGVYYLKKTGMMKKRKIKFFLIFNLMHI